MSIEIFLPSALKNNILFLILLQKLQSDDVTLIVFIRIG